MDRGAPVLTVGRRDQEFVVLPRGRGRAPPSPEREAKFSWLWWSFAFYQGCSEKAKDDQPWGC